MAKNSEITINFDKEEKSIVTITATIPESIVTKHKNDSLHHLGEGITIKGFRKGKAPLNKIEAEVIQQDLINHTLEHIFPDILKAVFKSKDLRLSGNPTLKSLTTPSNADWTITLDFPLVPTFELGKYEDAVKKALKKTKSEEDKLKTLLDTLLVEIKLDVPSTLVEQEINHSLTRLYDQTKILGITVEQYLKSLNKTPDQIRAEYQNAAEENLKIEFILDAIAKDKKIAVTEAEIDDLIKASGDQSAKKDLNEPNQRLYVKGILKKRKTIDELMKL